ncbi:Uncharacterized protein GNX_2522 [Leptospira interrogans serovar Canicola]|nr:Uncharacterized protein GNX_2522 [Leptospira interrogans serovar Canicola]
MIQILARETNVEFAGTGKFRIELLPVALFKTHESLLEYCHRKGYKKKRVWTGCRVYERRGFKTGS